MIIPELKGLSREVGNPMFGIRETSASELAPFWAVLEQFEKLYYPGAQEQVISLAELGFYFIDARPSAFPIHIAVPERLLPPLHFATSFGKTLFGWTQKPPEVGHPFTLLKWSQNSVMVSQGNASCGRFPPFEVRSSSLARGIM